MPVIATYLSTVFGPTSITKEGLSIFRQLDQTPAGIFASLGEVNEDVPRAFLTYIVFDKNFNPIAFDYDQVTEACKMPVSDHERLHTEVTIQKEGFIYVYISNQSEQNMDVYFDDFKVTHHYSDIVAGGDYYPFGLEIEDRRITREDYKFGYQGQFAEKDSTTGWNSFQLRMYDPVIGRWTSTDPRRVGYSPYIGMANNPVSQIDPDGGDPDDWFKNSRTGEVKWFASSEASISEGGDSWDNVGTERLEFNGNFLNYYWQEGNAVDGYRIYKQSYFADSGRPLSNGSFNYSKERQELKGTGPIPEGEYHVLKDQVQNHSEIGFLQEVAGAYGRGTWRGGPRAWGYHRYEIYPKSITTEGGNVRGDFFIHGGEVPGSAGCIDLCGRMTPFTSNFNRINSGSNKVTLGVHYGR